MTVRLTVRRAAWDRHVRTTAAAIDGLVPVVKGNGYGFGRATLHTLASALADEVCVGTVHELDHLQDGVTPIVLTPTRRPPMRSDAVLTVGSLDDVTALHDWHGSVLIKLRSSMLRFGVGPDDLAALVASIGAEGLTIAGASIHLPLVGTDDDRLDEIDGWLPPLDVAWPVYVSHLSSQSFVRLQRSHPGRTFRLRAGTALWHGDKSFLHLGADVIAVQPVDGAEVAGYRGRPIAAGSTLVMIGAGSANGVVQPADGASPFHYHRRRLVLVEPPHMHTSMVVIAANEDVPAIGELVDVQRPLITTHVDELVWTE